MTAPITSFQGEYRFLSNFWFCEVLIDGVVWPTTEHYYVAMKTLDPALREQIREIPRPGQVKRFGRSLELRPDWDDVKVDVMRTAITAKFTQSGHLLQKLVDTGDAQLIESNTWGDTFWGVCHGEGENWLGRILMEVRAELAEPWEVSF